MKISKYQISFRPVLTAAIISAAFITGCKVAQPEPLPPVKAMPEQFSNTAASQDSGRLVFRELFPDQQLISLIDSALKNNADINIAYQRIVSAQAQLMNRRRALLPSVDARIAATADRYGDYTLNGVGNFDTNLSPNIDKDQQIPLSPTTDMWIGLQSSWEIDLWGKLGALRKAAASDLLAQQQARRVLVTSIVSVIAQGYYELISLDAELEIVRKNIKLQEEAVEIVIAQKAGGRATELAVQQFEAQLLNTKAIEHQLLQQRVQTENQLNSVAGAYTKQIARASVLPATIPAIHAGVPSSLLLRRPDIMQAELSLQAANENVKAARASFFPSLTIHPYIALNAFTPSLLFNAGSLAWGAAGQLTAPLLNRRQIKTDFTIANAANREMMYSYQQKLVEAYNEVSTNISAVNQHQHAFRLKTQEVQELKEAVQTARDLYLTGYANYLEVITAQKNMLEAELQSTRQKQTIFTSVIRLYASLGGGWENS
ncbi:MAG: efflux transporter outer membrane subunit [Pseudobacter sp.]|uniref:efflux transporter outer membrane subunit n=1 Tax=Pseudobacter sp. TaxID=2045420 RepID=UPI003F813C42